MFNPEPICDFMDAIFVGEGERHFKTALDILDECRVPGQGIDKEKLLYRWASETQFMYVPKNYKVEYFSGYGIKTRETLKPEAKPIIRRATADLYNIRPNSFTFVPVITGGNMSIGSQELSRGCSAMCRFAIAPESLVKTAQGISPLGQILVNDIVLSKNGDAPVLEAHETEERKN